MRVRPARAYIYIYIWGDEETGVSACAIEYIWVKLWVYCIHIIKIDEFFFECDRKGMLKTYILTHVAVVPNLHKDNFFALLRNLFSRFRLNNAIIIRNRKCIRVAVDSWFDLFSVFGQPKSRMNISNRLPFFSGDMFLLFFCFFFCFFVHFRSSCTTMTYYFATLWLCWLGNSRI